MKPSVPLSDILQAASDLLKLAGFEFRNASMKTDSCYYGLPGRPELLRLSSHSKKKDSAGLSLVVVKLTFNGNNQDEPGWMHISPEKVELMIAAAMGRYMLACAKRDGARASANPQST